MPRELPPIVGPATAVHFPPIERDELASGLRVWFLPWHAVPVVTVALVIRTGASEDPAEAPGLAALTGDLVDEGAGGRDAAQLADAFASLGTQLDLEVGQDTTSLSLTTLARHLDPAIALLADVVARPHLADADFHRVRDLRLSRLRQLSSSAGAAADRALLAAIYGSHPYGHGTLGTTRALQSIELDRVRTFHAKMFDPAHATLIVAGDLPARDVTAAARAHFEVWRRETRDFRRPIAEPEAVPARVVLVDRAGAPQSELRVGHTGPPRQSPGYHALVTLNAALGGQFTSRINQNLRESKGYTYGARTSFDFRPGGSTFACDTSVQGDATARAVHEILGEFGAVRGARPIGGDELTRARRTLTRGYVRHFETPAHLARAAAELARHGLPDDTFDRFVPAVESINEEDVLAAAQQWVHPEAAVAVVVGDAATCRDSLLELGREVVVAAPEF